MFIKSVVQTSYSGMYKVEPSEGAVFYIRNEYLFSLCVDELSIEEELSDALCNELLDAGLAGAIELKAVEYLARAEQSRFGLSRKLFEKGYSKKYSDMALDYLEKRGYLSDERFARAWLNTRRINHYEGRSRLLAELMSRGISKEVSLVAINAFFEENDEEEICRKALEKLTKRGKSGEKLIAAMIQAGFPYKDFKDML